MHDYNADNEPSDEIIRFDLYGGHPYHEDKELNDRFDMLCNPAEVDHRIRPKWITESG